MRSTFVCDYARIHAYAYSTIWEIGCAYAYSHTPQKYAVCAIIMNSATTFNKKAISERFKILIYLKRRYI